MLQASRALLRRLGARNVNTTTIPVLFGSQTGTAKMMARQLARAAKSDPTVKAQGISLKAVSMASMTPQEVADHAHVVVVAASYGQGEPTDNAKEFFEGLKRLEDAALFGQTKVAVGAAHVPDRPRSGSPPRRRRSRTLFAGLRARLEQDVPAALPSLSARA